MNTRLHTPYDLHESDAYIRPMLLVTAGPHVGCMVRPSHVAFALRVMPTVVESEYPVRTIVRSNVLHQQLGTDRPAWSNKRLEQHLRATGFWDAHVNAVRDATVAKLYPYVIARGPRSIDYGIRCRPVAVIIQCLRIGFLTVTYIRQLIYTFGLYVTHIRIHTYTRTKIDVLVDSLVHGRARV
jgi:hypothetical protein